MKKLKLEEALRLLEQAEVIACPELGSINCIYELNPELEYFLEIEDYNTDYHSEYSFQFLKGDNQSVCVDGNLMTLVASTTGEYDRQRVIQIKLLAPINFEEA